MRSPPLGFGTGDSGLPVLANLLKQVPTFSRSARPTWGPLLEVCLAPGTRVRARISFAENETTVTFRPRSTPGSPSLVSAVEPRGDEPGGSQHLMPSSAGGRGEPLDSEFLPPLRTPSGLVAASPREGPGRPAARLRGALGAAPLLQT